jgi:hypothetical protein
MDVGINYPWYDYGWDFGAAPPGWRRRAEPNWTRSIRKDLRRLGGLGIKVVRWFILADGLAYGSGPHAPHVDAGRWDFLPLHLSVDFIQQFTMLLEAFREAGLQLIPVLVDHTFCLAGEDADTTRVPAGSWIKGGRAGAFATSARCNLFLDRVLDPLLEVCRDHRDAIYAWELMNEPDWVTEGWHPGRAHGLAVSADVMAQFLTRGIDRVRRAAFRATVGFARAETIPASGVECDIYQFHYYPDERKGQQKKLPRHRSIEGRPVILGEFATGFLRGQQWPDLGEEPEEQSMLRRLSLARQRRYPLVLPWSFRTSAATGDERSAWTRDVEKDILAFTTAPAP